jgi:AraC family transcriptional regulator
MVDQITREAAHANVGGPLYAEALGVQLSVRLLRDYASCITRQQNIPGCLSPAQQACLEDYIDAHLRDRITLEAMAGLLDMGVWTFSLQVRKSLGCTAYALVMRRRVERARVLLVRSRMPLKQIAATCGFSDQARMTRQFQVQHGTTPSQYRQMA